METTLMRAAAAATLALALGSAASAQQSGDSSGYIGGGRFSVDPEAGGDSEGIFLNGSFFKDLGGSFDLQADAESRMVDDGGDDSLTGQLHLFKRSESKALGGFATLIDPDGGDNTWGFGGEGELYKEDWTFGGSATWFESDAVDSLYGFCGYGRLYTSDDLSIEGRASLLNSDDGGGPGDDEENIVTLGAAAEYMFSGSGIAVGASFDRSEVEDSEATTIMFGGKYHFGSETLRQRDRQGAGLKGANCVRGGLF
jgi:hypothetical protein